MKNRILTYVILTVVFISSISAQINEPTAKKKKAWEIGLGGSVFQFSRTSFSNFSSYDKGYKFDLKLSHVLWGANMYIAREINPHFYIDLQGTAGFTNEKLNNSDKNQWLYMIGPGFQWRLGEYFGSKYIDPYLRAGISYMHKDFKILYEGQVGPTSDEMSWIMENFKNKDGADRKDLMPISLGGGLNMWLNDQLGIGFQADYLIMPYKQVANSIQGTARFIWRIGGTSKKNEPIIEYVEIEKIVEKIVEKPVTVEKVVEKVVEKPVMKDVEMICKFFNNIHFEFDKATLTAPSEIVLNEIARLLIQNSSENYLITGYTDSKGSPKYNEILSQKRASTIVEGLVERGVPRSILKLRGVGSKISYANQNASEDIRQGDRKVTIELISNKKYWDYLK